MDQHLLFSILGLANGSIYAALALTVVVTYRSSGVINFASGAMALFGAYNYVFLRDGEVLIPVPGFPQSVIVADELGFWPAAALSVLATALLGLVLYVSVFRPLRRIPPLGRAVASIGVMLLLSGLLAVRVGSTPVQAEPILPVDSWQVGGAIVTSDRIWFALIIVGIAVLVSAAFRFTRFGLLTRAAADSEKGAYVSGIRPDRVAAANWMLSGGVAAVAGILIAPIVPLTTTLFTLFIVPSLAAAVLGNFQRLLPAVLGGLLIGMAQGELTYLSGKYDWLPSSGRDETLVLVLLLLVLVVRGRPLPSRGVVAQSSLGRAPRPRRVFLCTSVGVLVGAGAVVLLSGDWLVALITTMILAIVSLSLVIVTGYAGQISLAQLTLAGVAGFTVGGITSDWGVPFPLAPLIASLIAALMGVVIGLPALRVRGLPVAVVTIAIAVTVEALWFRNIDFVSASGVSAPGPTLFGLDLRAQSGFEYPRRAFALLCLATLVLTALAVAALRRSALGSRMLAVRANERSAAGAGIAVVPTKLFAFAAGAFVAGLGGSLLAYFRGSVTFTDYSVFAGLFLFAFAYLAGVTSVSGGLLAGVIGSGGIFALALERSLGIGPDVYVLFSGLGLVLVLMAQPEGLVGPAHVWMERRRRAGVTAPSPSDEIRPADLLQALPPVAGGQPVLTVSTAQVRYGGVVAVRDVDLEARRGTIVGLIGPNGAGKTTLLDAISGFAPMSGSTRLGHRDVSRLSAHHRVRAGLGRTFQHAELYEDLSVRENVGVGRAAAHGRAARPMDETLALLDLLAVADVPVSELSHGQRQLVSIARALIGDPEVLLLDEPAGGLDSRESQRLGLRLRAIRDSGVTVLIVDHDMHLVLTVCDDIYVLDFGAVIAHGPPAQIRTDQAVATAYLGQTHATPEVLT